MLNPYSSRGAIVRGEEFFGREHELTEIYSLITQGQFVSLVGERRVGKTSILNALRLGFGVEHTKLSVPEGLCFAFVDCMNFEKEGERGFLKFLLRRISREIPVPSLEPTRDSFWTLACEVLPLPDGKRLVILLDEFDVLVHNSSFPSDFYSFLRSWTQESEVPLIIVSREGSLKPLVEAGGQPSPFWNIFQAVYVGPMQIDEADELVRRPAATLEVPFSDEQSKEIMALGGRHPFFLNIACYYMFQFRVESESLGLDWKVEQEFRRYAGAHFEYLLRERLSVSERKALASFVCRSEALQGITLADLLRKGIVIEEERKVRVFSRVFRDMIGQLAEAEPEKHSVVRRIKSGLLE